MKIPNPTDKRIESGQLQIGDDWPGVFIRGDDAMYYARRIRVLLSSTHTIDPIERTQLQSLADLLDRAYMDNT